MYRADHIPGTRIVLEATGQGSAAVDNDGNVMGIDLELDSAMVPNTYAG